MASPFLWLKPFLVESRRGTAVHGYAVLVSMANLQIFEFSNHQIQIIITFSEQFCWRNFFGAIKLLRKL
jgi:hypothetical protein